MVKLLPILGMAVALSMSASAATVFFDNFDSETKNLDVSGLANWNIGGGSVDVIGEGFWDFYAGQGQGLYLDLDGTKGSLGNAIISTNTIFDPGTYTLSFLLGNNPGSGSKSNTLTVSMGDVTIAPDFISSNPMNTMTLQTVTFTTTVAGALTFVQGGDPDQQGSIIDDVRLESSVTRTQTPEPATWALFAGAGAVLMALGRFRK